MKRATVGVFCIAIIAASFTVSIGAIYALALPKGPGWGVHAPLFLGIMIATSLGGYVGYRVPRTEKPLTKVGFGFAYAAVVAVLVSYLSLLIILNTRGS